MRIDRSSSSEEYVEPVLRSDATERTQLIKRVRKSKTFKLPSLNNKTRLLPSFWALEIEPLSPRLQKKINRICDKVVGSQDMSLREWYSDNT